MLYLQTRKCKFTAKCYRTILFYSSYRVGNKDCFIRVFRALPSKKNNALVFFLGDNTIFKTILFNTHRKENIKCASVPYQKKEKYS